MNTLRSAMYSLTLLKFFRNGNLEHVTSVKTTTHVPRQKISKRRGVGDSDSVMAVGSTVLLKTEVVNGQSIRTGVLSLNV